MGSPGDFLYPFPVPCCSLVLLAVVVALAFRRWSRRVDDGADDGGPPTAAAGGSLAYARSRPRVLRRTVVAPPFWRLAAVAGGLFLAANTAWFAYLDWDHRTRTTTLLLVDPKTGRPSPVTPGDVYVDCPDPWSTSSVSYPAPGTVRVEWSHACDVEFSPGTWAGKPKGDVTLATVDDASPATITVPFTP